MKFALTSLLCALIPLGFGCTSTEKQDSKPAAIPASGSGVGGIERFSEISEETAAPAAPKGPAYLLRMIDYRTNIKMELVNESHTPHAEQYSKVRADPSRKVTTDEWMSGLIEYLDDQGWSKENKGGNAPTMAQGSLAWSLQLVGPDGASYIAAPLSMKGSQATRMVTMKNAFLQTYNATPGFQAVQNEPGKLPFKAPEGPTQLKPKSGG